MDRPTAARSTDHPAWSGRVEDGALVRGQGRFGDDVKPEGALAAYFVRSPHAFATITGVDTARGESVGWCGRGADGGRSRSRALSFDLARPIRFPAAAARCRCRRIVRRWRAGASCISASRWRW